MKGDRRSARSAASSDLRSPIPIAYARGLFITGTDTGVGKTVVAVRLLRGLVAAGRARGRHEAGGRGRFRAPSGLNDDVVALEAAGNVSAPLARAQPVFASASTARRIWPRAGPRLHIELARDPRAPTNALSARADALIVEGAGGALVPLGRQDRRARRRPRAARCRCCSSSACGSAASTMRGCPRWRSARGLDVRRMGRERTSTRTWPTPTRTSRGCPASCPHAAWRRSARRRRRPRDARRGCFVDRGAHVPTHRHRARAAAPVRSMLRLNVFARLGRNALRMPRKATLTGLATELHRCACSAELARPCGCFATKTPGKRDPYAVLQACRNCRSLRFLPTPSSACFRAATTVSITAGAGPCSHCSRR